MRNWRLHQKRKHNEQDSSNQQFYQREQNGSFQPGMQPHAVPLPLADRDQGGDDSVTADDPHGVGVPQMTPSGSVQQQKQENRQQQDSEELLSRQVNRRPDSLLRNMNDLD